MAGVADKKAALVRPLRAATLKPAAFRPRAKRPGWGAQPFASATFGFALHWQGPRGPGPLPCCNSYLRFQIARKCSFLQPSSPPQRKAGGPLLSPAPEGRGTGRGWGEAADNHGSKGHGLHQRGRGAPGRARALWPLEGPGPARPGPTPPQTTGSRPPPTSTAAKATNWPPTTERRHHRRVGRTAPSTR